MLPLERSSVCDINLQSLWVIKAFVEEYYKNYRHSPSTTEIADAVGIARRTAYKYLVAMNENGMIRYDGQQISTEQNEKVQTEFTSVALSF